MIRELCRQHTDLCDADIKKIIRVAENLDTIANLMEADIFIDCYTSDSDVAVVVAQARPLNVKSLYKNSVVGQFAARNKEPAVLRTMEIGLPTSDMWAVTQENKNVRQSVSPIKNACGKVIATLIAEKDVTDDVQARKDLSLLARTNEHLMEALVSPRDNGQGISYFVTDGIVIFDHLGLCTYVNPVADKLYKKLGYMDELVGIGFGNITLEDISFREVLEKKQSSLHDVKAGQLVLHIKYAVMKNKKSKLTGLVMLISDVTDVRAKEKELVLKSVAISEIHHRVKNNLQNIASLLRLQARRMKTDSGKTALKESINRVLSIAATHEILSEEGGDEVDIKTMLKKIQTGVADQSRSSNKDIVISIEGDTFVIDSDKATSIALVVNELVQNCFKYAFPHRKSGKIKICIKKGPICSSIFITDDGVGYNVEHIREGSLGFTIVTRIVADKLNGTISVDSGVEGTIVVFDFPLDENGGNINSA